MPLAEGAGGVALFPEHLGDGEVAGFEDGSAEGANDAVEAAPVVLPGEKGEAAGGADP